MIRAALHSKANLAVIPVQDVLGLGSASRMNRPGVEGGNWSWRMEHGTLTEEIAKRLLEMTHESGRG